jgi:hypothetical protein
VRIPVFSFDLAVDFDLAFDFVFKVVILSEAKDLGGFKGQVQHW